MLKEKKNAPNFVLKDKDAKEWELKKIKSKYVVLYFYPKDNTPGCTIEALLFNKYLSDFKNLDVTIMGISGGNEKSKTKFCDKHKLKLLLLSDMDFSVAKIYGVYGEKSFMGKKYTGIERSTFILDKNQKIIKVYFRVNPSGHAKEVLDYISTLTNGNKKVKKTRSKKFTISCILTTKS
ncbi:thioredoxin-dependent thiol peroxidase [Candidatus Woesearchaeota archaeon CG_4_10_14_0_2_um_filter_33_13]|nr:MAG: thioredoxin-dependent thiol peroxidase [Candidatus Woesearchaeota archaeon CG_4_10_14_0_2_um_filter_33_13]